MYNLTDEQIDFLKQNIFKVSHDIIKEKLNLSTWKYTNLIKKMELKKETEEIILYRFCPQCKNKLTYINKYNKIEADKKNQICRKCDNLNRKTYYKGENNPFFGKEHTTESIEQMSKTKIGKHYSPETQFKKGNIPHGESFYNIWIEKYGIVEANKKMIDFKNKQSFNNSGTKNKMYGKPSPKGSGNGWSGWYKGWYFRSLLELSYMINIIERFDLKWENGESNKYKIQYRDENNMIKNYFPDFIINNKYVVECKPKKLWNNQKNLLKKEGALLFCKTNNLKYKIVVCDNLKVEETIKLYLNGKITFVDKYKKRIEEIIKKNKS